ncbi:SUMF1/EgtB/PvdO family nonheme iron enzyme [Lewinella sp. W8]|uniref:SUMF1/EgtB/PvdO family nonheme iron enzyme n=1 Tax=Lewinella sp. W8 TaxID=2528208 RepID=UPI001067585E|nr:SUMF1/EgtB/PvdO family nonheme iron enzyme [Lewinella sp. W8]MTB52769.1 SUMF1/EgtB/PvdO family nonheme iron enzyme [Lewinella sp. W8]
MISPRICFLIPLMALAFSLPAKDYAIFFAVDNYSQVTGYDNLSDPIASAEKLSAELKDMYGFSTEVVKNPSRTKIYEKLREYRRKTFGHDDQLLVFFSGHGEFDEFEVKGYFVPYAGRSIDLTTLGNIVTEIPCRHILLAIDACYSGTIDAKIAFKGRTFSRAGVTADTERQNLIARKLRNKSRLLLTSGAKERTPSRSGGSPFALGFLNTLRAAYGSGDGLVTYEDLLARMERVSPVPHHGRLIGHEEGSFVFVTKGIVPPPPPPPVVNRTARNTTTRNPPPDNMVFIPGGTFQMGDQFGDGDEDEKPLHSVTVSDFYLSKTELTNREYAEFLSALGNREQGGTQWYEIGSKDAGITGSGNSYVPKAELVDHPVVEVSWYGAVAYCNWLSERHGLKPAYRVSGSTVTPDWTADGYRLPTEAEWEYAARSAGKREKWAGTSSEGELTQFANISGEADGYARTAPVGMLRANNLGLGDMSGNVWEWCWDWYGVDYYGKSPGRNPKGPKVGSLRVIRGGSWYRNPQYCRVADRINNGPSQRNNTAGFRLARNAN